MSERGTRLVILLEHAVTAAAAQSALRYASTAAALDVAVEVHAVGASVALLHRACGQGMQAGDLIDGVAGIRGAASLLAAGLAPGGRFMVF